VNSREHKIAKRVEPAAVSPTPSSFCVRTVATVAISCCLVFLAASAGALDSRFSDSANDADALLRSGDLEGASETLEPTLAAALASLGADNPDVAELTSRLALL
jgi:hypothetical protein